MHNQFFMNKPSVSDSELWNLIILDDDRAYVIFFERHWFKLYKALQYYHQDAMVCEEIVHNVFLNLWNRRKVLIITDFNNYLKAATRYELFAYLKKHKLSLIDYHEKLASEDIPATSNAASDKILYADLEDKLLQYLKVLPKRCQEIFILSRMQHLSNIQIAEKLGVSKRTVENQLTIALQSIRSNIKKIFLLTISWISFF